MDQYSIRFVDTVASDIEGRYYFIMIDINYEEDQLWIVYDTVDKQFYLYSLAPLSGYNDTFTYRDTTGKELKVYVYKNISRQFHPVLCRFLNFIKFNKDKHEEFDKEITKRIVEGVL